MLLANVGSPCQSGQGLPQVPHKIRPWGKGGVGGAPPSPPPPPWGPKKFFFFCSGGCPHLKHYRDLLAGLTSPAIFIWPPLVAWVAIFPWGLFWYRLWINWRGLAWSRPTQGSFSLASMLGNNSLHWLSGGLTNCPQLGLEWFGWGCVIYDALGTLLGSYGFGAILASEFSADRSGDRTSQWRNRLRQVLRNPIIWAFGFGLLLKQVALPGWLEPGAVWDSLVCLSCCL